MKQGVVEKNPNCKTFSRLKTKKKTLKYFIISIHEDPFIPEYHSHWYFNVCAILFHILY